MKYLLNTNFKLTYLTERYAGKVGTAFYGIIPVKAYKQVLFTGVDRQDMSEITSEIATDISNQYMELYKALTGNRLII